ncbi:MAG: hypothetical protein ABSF38_02510 [Verrucomicrobiota bacterium]
MSVRANMAWAGLAGGAILLGGQRACLAATGDAPPALPAAAASDDNSNPYSVIIDRNVFRLNPPPPPDDNKDKGPPPDLPVVKLSGFIKTADKLKVLLAVSVKTGDSKAPEAMYYLTMVEDEVETVGEGDKRAVEKLVKVYPGEEKVDIENSGTRMTLSLKENGFGQAPAAALAGGRGVGTAAIRAVGAPAGATPGVPAALPRPGVPGMGAAAPFQGDNSGGANTMVGGANYNRPSFNSGTATSFGGGTAVNTGFQSQQSAFQSGGFNARTGGGILSGGAAPISAPAGSPGVTLPLNSPAGLNHLTQPNSTPMGNGITANGEMPPVPGAQPNQ